MEFLDSVSDYAIFGATASWWLVCFHTPWTSSTNRVVGDSAKGESDLEPVQPPCRFTKPNLQEIVHEG